MLFGLPVFNNAAIALGVAYVAVLVWMLMLSRSKKLHIPLIIIVAGGLSNLIDRIWRGFVLDIIQIGSFQANIADLLIVSGVGIFVFTVVTSAHDRVGETEQGDR